MRHTGAGGFACSSTVQINVLVLGQVLDLFVEIVGLDPDRAVDSFGADVVIAVATNVDDLNLVALPGGDPSGKLLDVYSRNHIVAAVLEELHHAIADVSDHRDDQKDFHRPACRLKALQDGGQKIAEDISDQQV